MLAHDEANDGRYDTKKVKCHSCAAQERATKGTSKDPYVPEPGERIATVYAPPRTPPPGAQLFRAGA